MSELAQEWAAAAIRSLIGAHTQAQDAGRTDDLVALYTPDAVLEVPGMPRVVGHTGLREAFKGWEPSVPQLHVVANTVVTVVGTDDAAATSDASFLQRGENGWAVQLVGHYQDTLVRQDSAWRFSRRVTTFQV
ncbi:YybH family protein [Streptomyces sp. NPDC056656]|uniref:YybH family protein n=1 Tax=Streptomyces sp. NPDC056656 TaxID=3345895 RepID=UPI0036BDE399